MVEPPDWRKGWRNLHHDGPSLVEASFQTEGRTSSTIVARSWDAATTLDASEGYAQHEGEKRISIDDLGWTDALATVRPMLSYNELGSMLEEGPSKLHDALASILGLGDLSEAVEELRQGRLERGKMVKASAKTRADLIEALSGVEGDRTSRARDLLEASGGDLDPLERLVTGDDINDGDRDARIFAGLDLPTMEEATEDAAGYICRSWCVDACGRYAGGSSE